MSMFDLDKNLYGDHLFPYSHEQPEYGCETEYKGKEIFLEKMETHLLNNI